MERHGDKKGGAAEKAKSRVVKIDCEQTWEIFTTQARNQGCPVVVHFGAEWCMPSRAMKPVFEQMAFLYRHILFLSVDVDHLKDVAGKMEIKAMPTFVLMKEGEAVDKIVGANPHEMKKRISDFIYSNFLHLKVASN